MSSAEFLVSMEYYLTIRKRAQTGVQACVCVTQDFNGSHSENDP